MSKGLERVRRFGILVAGCLAVWPFAASAQEDEATLLAYAAGYEASCSFSAIFNGGKSL